MQEQPRAITVVAPRKTWRGKTRRALLFRSTAAFVLVVFMTLLFHGNWPLALLCLCGGIGLWEVRESVHQRRERTAILSDVDAMTTGEFRHYAAELLRAQGYTILRTGRSLDPRADLFLSRGKKTIACWLHHGTKNQSTAVVERALVATRGHNDSRVMILASQPLTWRARTLARQEGFLLIDRETLANMVVQYRRGHKVLVLYHEETNGLRTRK
jgi:hypothetical protein